MPLSLTFSRVLAVPKDLSAILVLVVLRSVPLNLNSQQQKKILIVELFCTKILLPCGGFALHVEIEVNDHKF